HGDGLGLVAQAPRRDVDGHQPGSAIERLFADGLVFPGETAGADKEADHRAVEDERQGILEIFLATGKTGLGGAVIHLHASASSTSKAIGPGRYDSSMS